MYPGNAGMKKPRTVFDAMRGEDKSSTSDVPGFHSGT